MSTHTPGPWDFRSEGVYGLARVERFAVYPNHGATTFSVAVCSNYNAEANARLIAAAPDLLAALEEMTSKGEGCAACGDGTKGGCGCRYERARAAIAKVRGDR